MSLDAEPRTSTADSPSTRRSSTYTGLEGPATEGTWKGLLPPPEDRTKPLSWLDPRALWHSRNQLLARVYDPVPRLRREWTHDLSDADLAVDLGYAGFSFALMGDTGEGDNSQYALIPSLNRECSDVEFLFLCSDLIYPGGDVNQYGHKFYRPYRHVPLPIYAIPGNHDWYDSLEGFMAHLVDPERRRTPASVGPVSAEPEPTEPGRSGRTTPSLLRRATLRVRRAVEEALWKPAAEADEAWIAKTNHLRADWPQPVAQPGPYFVLDTEHVRFVCVDPGILGNLDPDQGQWLIRVSAESDKPKVLLSGKPLLVDGTTDPCPILESSPPFRTVLDVVHHLPFGYVAAIAGDVHNYQHYPVHLTEDPTRPDRCRTIHHVVSGGGGAFMHATHAIRKIDPGRVFGVTEEQFRCYPLRRHSLAVYSRVIDTRVRKSRLGTLLHRVRLCPDLTVTSDEAAIYLRDHREIVSLTTGDMPATDRSAAELPARVRRICAFVLGLGGGKVFHRLFSPFLDWDDPPFSKSFLRIDVDQQGMRVRCFSVTGTLELENEPLVEDEFVVPWPARAS